MIDTSVDWQAIVAILIVAAAALWLARRVWRTVATGLRGGKVGSCASCTKNPDAGDAKPLVQLGKRSE